MSDTSGISGSSNQHARLSPSDSKRWGNCTASIAYQEANSHRVKKDDESDYSREGTEAHEWAAKLLLNQITEKDIPENFRDYVVAYRDHCVSLVPAGHTYEVEVEVPLYYQEEQHGTCDFSVISDKVVIRDLKYGAGVLVSSFENPQLAIYAYSLIKHLEGLYSFSPDTEIDIAVFQPRHREGASQRPWITTLAGLAAFCEKIEYKAIQARTGADRVKAKLPCGGRDIAPSEIIEAAPMVKFEPEEGDSGSCRWCKSKAFCSARFAAMTAGLEGPDSEYNPAELLTLLPDLTKEEKKKPVGERLAIATDTAFPIHQFGNELPDSYLVKLLECAPAITKFLADVDEYMEGRIVSGEKIEGLKCVMGREGNREYRNQEEAETFLRGQKLKGEDIYTKKLITPTQAEKLLDFDKMTTRGKNRWDAIVVRSAAKKVMALASDNRPEVPTLAEALPDLDASSEEEEVDDFVI